MTDTQAALATLRANLAGLLSQLDHGTKPRPDQIVPASAGEKCPGARWRPASRWVVRSIDEAEVLDTAYVYVTTPQHFALEESTDFTALTTDEARAVAMAFLAAADWADGLAAPNVRQLDAAREQR